MKIRLLLVLVLFCCAMNSFAQKHAKPISIIFDSDIGPDYDDVGAITILHTLADAGEAKILATMASNRYQGVASVLDIFNTYFNRPDIPIGVAGPNAANMRDGQHWTDTLIAKYPHKIKTNAEAWDAVKLYRKILSKQPAGSVTIVTIGFLTNISDLLNSPADEYSKLTGKELIQQKVKQLVSMAGKFPAGYEFNVIKDAASADNVFQHISIPVIYSGFEIGEKIKVGLPLINDSSIQNSPVKDVFKICIPKSADDVNGRMSWDETAVLVAIKGYQTYYGLHPGKMAPLAADGKNSWNDGGKEQGYLIEKLDHLQMQDLINRLIMHQPKK